MKLVHPSHPLCLVLLGFPVSVEILTERWQFSIFISDSKGTDPVFVTLLQRLAKNKEVIGNVMK